MLDDNGYQIIARTENIEVSLPEGLSEFKIGDIALYKSKRLNGFSIDHSGILAKFSPDPIILSKFGLGGEYFHPIDHVPQGYGKIVEIWTDREIQT